MRAPAWRNRNTGTRLLNGVIAQVFTLIIGATADLPYSEPEVRPLGRCFQPGH